MSKNVRSKAAKGKAKTKRSAPRKAASRRRTIGSDPFPLARRKTAAAGGVAGLASKTGVAAANVGSDPFPLVGSDPFPLIGGGAAGAGPAGKLKRGPDGGIS